MKYLVWGILCSLFALRAFAGEPVYTVDCNGGGDFRTVQECFDALPSKPDGWRTVRILPGTYREKVTLDVYKDRVRIVGEHFKRLTDLHILESLFGFEHRLRALHPAAVQRCSHDDQASFSAIQARALSSAAGSALTSEAPAMAMSGLPPPLPPH